MLVPDLSLIRITTLEDCRKNPFIPLGVSHFQKEPYNLYYINAHHGFGIDHPSFRTAQKAIDFFKPEAIVIERRNDEVGHSAQMAEENKSDGFKKITEAEYTAYLAKQRNIPLIGAEPEESVIFKDLTHRGFSAKELVYKKVLGNIVYGKGNNEICGVSVDDFSKACVNWFSEIYSDYPIALSFKEMKEWFLQQHAGYNSLFDIKSDDLAPSLSNNATRIQAISYYEDVSREQSIVPTISNALNQHKMVLVVYGAAHLESERAVFIKMLGQPTFKPMVPVALPFSMHPKIHTCLSMK
ncbi:MAG: hypothetical protein AB7E52_03305 [Bdellovibrionales bacterium]